MTHLHVSTPPPNQVDPLRLTVLLETLGWKLVGGRRAVYNRLLPPGDVSEREQSLIVPTDRTAPEFEELMGAALAQLAVPAYRDVWQRLVTSTVDPRGLDEFRVCKETEAPAGLIRWQLGQGLIQQVRGVLIAGAKAFVDPAPYYISRLGQFARRFIDTTFMGQTEPGSYAVTAFVPTHQTVSLYSTKADTLGIAGIDAATTRQITQAIINAIDATVEAVDHQRSTSSFSGFEAGIERGISFELVNALSGITSESDGAEIVLEPDIIDRDPGQLQRRMFVFGPTDSSVLHTAGVRLLEAEPSRRAVVVGRVHLLTKKELGMPGVVGIETTGQGPRKVRAHLTSPEDYHQAVRAHDEDLLVRVTGDLRREGNLHWLYSGRLEGLISPDELSQRVETTDDESVLEAESDDGSEEQMLF